MAFKILNTYLNVVADTNYTHFTHSERFNMCRFIFIILTRIVTNRKTGHSVLSYAASIGAYSYLQFLLHFRVPFNGNKSSQYKETLGSEQCKFLEYTKPFGCYDVTALCAETMPSLDSHRFDKIISCIRNYEDLTCAANFGENTSKSNERANKSNERSNNNNERLHNIYERANESNECASNSNEHANSSNERENNRNEHVNNSNEGANENYELANKSNEHLNNSNQFKQCPVPFTDLLVDIPLRDEKCAKILIISPLHQLVGFYEKKYFVSAMIFLIIHLIYMIGFSCFTFFTITVFQPHDIIDSFNNSFKECQNNSSNDSKRSLIIVAFIFLIYPIFCIIIRSYMLFKYIRHKYSPLGHAMPDVVFRSTMKIIYIFCFLILMFV